MASKSRTGNTSLRDPEFDAVSAKDIWSEAADRLKIVEDAESENRNRAKEAMANAKSDIDLAKAQSEFAMMAAQLAAIRKLRRK